MSGDLCDKQTSWNRIFYLSSFFLLLFHLSFAQEGGTTKLYGKVNDAATNSPIVGASVIVTTTKAGSRTDVEGNFFLQVKVGETYTIEISSVGYQTKVVNEIKALQGDNAHHQCIAGTGKCRVEYSSSKPAVHVRKEL